MGKIDQFTIHHEARVREEQSRGRFENEIGTLLQATKPIFDALHSAELHYALIRHTGILFSLYDLDFLSFLEEIDATAEINDVDILINFNEENILRFVELVKKIPGVQSVRLELTDDSDRIKSPYGFFSDAFITFTRVVELESGKSATYKYEIFANYGLEPEVRPDDMSSAKRELFAAIDEQGNNMIAGNTLETVDYEDNVIGSMQIPYIVGKGIARSYLVQNEENKTQFRFGDESLREALLGTGKKFQMRVALARLSQDLIQMLPSK